jgi:SAM-dependent methyltransferase
MRKPFQGVLNIIRFNRHFYLFALVLLPLVLVAGSYLEESLRFYVYFVCFVIAATIFVSLLVSCYVYDLSGLYRFDWIVPAEQDKVIVNINAGFDETSGLLKERFGQAQLITFDFYDPEKHTEVSIRRARKAYPPFPGTKRITTAHLPLENAAADKIFVILSAHEIRDEKERILFFKELKRILKSGGDLFVTEHLRDVPNFLAYNAGFFHFYSKISWQQTFRSAGLKIRKEIKVTPFISTFILEKDGNSF